MALPPNARVFELDECSSLIIFFPALLLLVKNFSRIQLEAAAATGVNIITWAPCQLTKSVSRLLSPTLEVVMASPDSSSVRTLTGRVLAGYALEKFRDGNTDIPPGSPSLSLIDLKATTKGGIKTPAASSQWSWPYSFVLELESSILTSRPWGEGPGYSASHSSRGSNSSITALKIHIHANPHEP